MKDSKRCKSSLTVSDGKDGILKKSGKVTGGFYTKWDNHLESEIVKRSGPFLYYNLMHYDFMYGIRHMECELILWFIKMFKGNEENLGTFTSGGTESIFMAVVSMREYAKQKKGITEPELIMPVTAHPAFNKACFYLGVKVVVIKSDESTNFVGLERDYRRKINRNTIGVRSYLIPSLYAQLETILMELLTQLMKSPNLV